MTDFVIRALGYAVGIPCPYEGQFLAAYTPHEKVKGTFTTDPDKAMRFTSKASAMRLWRTSIGKRPDGKPDRPLTAFTVEILSVEDAKIKEQLK